jgi:hypothetical protein
MHMGKSIITRFASLIFAIALAGANLVPCTAAILPAIQAACILRVDGTAASGGDGLSWPTAYQDLQTALSAAVSGCQVWVAKGTYTPTSGSDRDAHFSLNSGVALYGGFIGNETDLAQRDWQANLTTLSGEIGSTGTISDNSFHVVVANNANATARLDGFTITAGNTSIITGAKISGGGLDNLNGSPFLTNLNFTSNNSSGDGGGMANYGGSPVLLNVTFTNNHAFLTSGGGFYNFSGHPSLVDVSFIGNSAYAGGGMASELDNPTLTNVVFSNNTTLGTSGQGAGLFDLASSPTLDSVSFVDNVSSDVPTYGGGAIYNTSSSSPIIHNSIFWGNSDPQVLNQDAGSIPTFTYSDLQGGCQPGFNCNFIINKDPLFVNPALNDLHLQLSSPAIDAGNNSLLPADNLDLNHNGNTTEVLPLDRDGNLRQVDLPVADSGVGSAPIVDMGAFEARSRVYVAQTAAGANNGSSWQDAYPDLQSALHSAVSGSQVWVATGTYHPTTSLLDANASFQLRNGIALYGGFSGTELNLTDRRQRQNPTILDGLLGFRIFLGTIHSCHVVTGSGVDATAVLDGFTIANGKATTTAPCDQGGGIYLTNSSPTLADLRIENNGATNGAGIAVENTFSTPMLEISNIALVQNVAAQKGGGIYLGGGALVLLNATFNANSALSGAGIYKAGGTLSLQNDVLWGDTGTGSEVALDSGDAYPINSDYSLLQGCKPLGVWSAACGNGGSHNLADADPQFVNAAQGDLHLRNTSPAANHGLNPTMNGTDLDSSPRIMNLTIDLGAYEGAMILFVNPNSPGPAHDGLTWNTAFTTLQAALAQAGTPSWASPNNWIEIWVTKGTYLPTGTLDRTMSLNLHHYTGVYGGFSGHETARADRDWNANPTILSGDLKGDDGANFANTADNSYHVVTCFDDAKDAALDGFTITGGNANGSAAQSLNYGAGIYFAQAAPALSNLNINFNQAQYGGGLAADNGISKNLVSTVSNITFRGNWASIQGGGIFNNNNSLKLVNVVFWANHAGQGGGIYNDLGNLALINATFYANSSTNPGGGMYTLTNSFPNQTQVINTLMWADTPDESASNTVNQPVVSFSLLQGCNPANYWKTSCGRNAGSNLADSDPLFADPVPGNLTLRSASPAIDQGSSLALSPAVITDRNGNPRLQDSGVDLGAFEYLNLPPVVSNFVKWGLPDEDIFFTKADFTAHYSDPNGDALDGIDLVSLPARGKLYLGINQVVPGQHINAGSLDKLVFKPEIGYIGPNFFQWNGSDGIVAATNPATIRFLEYAQFVPVVKR